MKNIKKSTLLVIFLVAVLFVSCTQKPSSISLWDSAIYSESTVLGEGEKTIEIEVVAEEKSIVLTVKTNAKTLADALIENALVEGTTGQYGLYIEVVNGIEAKYEVDGYYWSLNKDGEYLMTGADTTEISDGEHYELIRTK